MKQSHLLALTLYGLRYVESQSIHVIKDFCDIIALNAEEYDYDSRQEIKKSLDWNINHRFIDNDRKEVYKALLLVI